MTSSTIKQPTRSSGVARRERKAKRALRYRHDMMVAIADRAFPGEHEPMNVNVLAVDPSTDVEGWSLWGGTGLPVLVEYGSMPRGSSERMIEARIKRCMELSGHRGLALVIEDQFLGASLSSMITVAGARFRWEVLYRLLGGTRIVRVTPLMWQVMLLEPGERRLPSGVSKARSIQAARKLLGPKALLDDNMADAVNLGQWTLAQVTGNWAVMP